MTVNGCRVYFYEFRTFSGAMEFREQALQMGTVLRVGSEKFADPGWTRNEPRPQIPHKMNSVHILKVNKDAVL